ncbi:MAG: hypothetical protein HQM16_08625 [Deltaproteobacteria bacterium]|nr:hypothetical protein [Deltaproteobacteria bacterium]
MNFIKAIVLYFSRLIAQVVCYVAEWIVIFCEWPTKIILGLFKKSEYIRTGACKMTGQCCHLIGMEFPQSWHTRTRLLTLVKKWHFLRYNFTYLGTVDSLLVYECGYVTKDNKCGIQRFKPALCRGFPKTPLTGYTKLHKGCGFSFVKRYPSEFEKILNKLTTQSHPHP